MSFVSSFLAVMSVVLLVAYVKKQMEREVDFVKVDDKEYLVLDRPDKAQAAALLAAIAKDLTRLSDYVSTTFPDDKEYQNLKNRFSADNLSEGSPDSGYTSYSLKDINLNI